MLGRECVRESTSRRVMLIAPIFSCEEKYLIPRIKGEEKSMRFEVTYINTRSDKEGDKEKFFDSIIIEAENGKRSTIWEACKKQGIKGVNVENWKKI